MAVDQTTPSLAEAYRKWLLAKQSPPGATPGQRRVESGLASAAARLTVAQMAAQVDAAAIEATAFIKSVKRTGRASRAGALPRNALLMGFDRYREKGGSLAFEAWRRKVAALR
jgi:hypothetical protein